MVSVSFSAGYITGGIYTGGLIGQNQYTPTGDNSYWDIETSGQTESDGGEGRITEEMTYPYAENTYNGWDFNNTWIADETYNLNNGYPVLLFSVGEIQSDFLAIPTETFINQPVQFEDLSTPVFTEWQWDFQNDGIYDAFEQNPSYTYTQPGTYSVKLKVSSEAMVDSLVKVDYITVTYVPPKPPENVEIVMVGNDAHIEWDAVTEDLYSNPIMPDYYFVYYNGSNNVDGEYYFHGLTTDTDYVHANVGLAENTMFYRVEAVVMLDRSQDISRLRRGMSTHEVGEIIGIQTHPKPLSSSE